MLAKPLDDAAQVVGLDEARAHLVADAQPCAAQLQALIASQRRAEAAGPPTRRTLALSWPGRGRSGSSPPSGG